MAKISHGGRERRVTVPRSLLPPAGSSSAGALALDEALFSQMESYNLTPSEMTLWQEGLKLCREVADLKTRLSDAERKLAASKIEISRLEEEKKAWKNRGKDSKEICSVLPCGWEITSKNQSGLLTGSTGCQEFRDELREINEDARKAQFVSHSLDVSFAKYNVIMRKIKREIGIPSTSSRCYQSGRQPRSKMVSEGQCRRDVKTIVPIGKKANAQDVAKRPDSLQVRLRSPPRMTEYMKNGLSVRERENSKQSEGGTKQEDTPDDCSGSNLVPLATRRCNCHFASLRELTGLEDELRKAIRLTQDTQELMSELFSIVDLKELKRVFAMQKHSQSAILASISRISTLSNKQNMRVEDLQGLKATLIDALCENPTGRKWSENEEAEMSWIKALVKKMNFRP